MSYNVQERRQISDHTPGQIGPNAKNKIKWLVHDLLLGTREENVLICVNTLPMRSLLCYVSSLKPCRPVRLRPKHSLCTQFLDIRRVLLMVNPTLASTLSQQSPLKKPESCGCSLALTVVLGQWTGHKLSFPQGPWVSSPAFQSCL